MRSSLLRWRGDGRAILRRAARFGLAVALLSSATPLRAAEPASAATLTQARAQFQQALALETAGDWAGASNLLLQVAAVRLTPQVRFHQALCEEQLGKLAAALGDYQIAAEEAEHAAAAEVAAQVAARVEGLRARVPKIVVRRGAGADFAKIALDGVSLGASSIGSELPVDPGPHTIDARAHGYQPFTSEWQITEGERKTVDIVLQLLPPVAIEKEVTHPEAAIKLPSADSSAASPLPFIVGGAGVATLAASAVFFGLRASALQSLESNCPTRATCPAAQKATYDRGRTYTVLADVTLGVGAAGVAAGAMLFLLGHKSSPKPTDASVAVAPAWNGGAGAELVGQF